MSGTVIKTKKEERPNSVRGINRTGIPLQLKERMEQNTGVSFDDVRVHYNSDLPAKLDALAYTKGNQVEIGPGQERHLPHELGHVVQQKLGLVRANARHASGEALNTDSGLERQADEIGAGKRVAIIQRREDNVVQRCEEEPKPEVEEASGLIDNPTVLYNGYMVPVYRSGGTFKARDNDIAIFKKGTEEWVRTTQGVSVIADLDIMKRNNQTPYKVDKLSAKLQIVQRGEPHHFEIVPIQEMSRVDYQKELNRTVRSKVKL